jgi:hypothetical protein
MHELTVAAYLFSDAGRQIVSCEGAAAATIGPRRTAAIAFQSLSLTSVDSFSAVSNVSVNLSDMTRYPMLRATEVHWNSQLHHSYRDLANATHNEPGGGRPHESAISQQCKGN